ncbi:MAG TPA: hypothetical protein VK869_05365, partial [Rubrobacteraceae bacterium]|nr:hypothetical protein [Rubrobacteraceae bacterium]
RSDDLAREVSATLREETDLDALSNELASVVRNTMQPPELVSLWPREPGGSLAHPRPGRGSPVE